MSDKATFLEKLSENFVKYADCIALSDDINTTGFTYRDLDRISGKVYSYLSEKGIGPEDFVMVNLPRRGGTFAICVGVWRAGAAFTICEEDYPPEKIDYIYNDCHCKLKITQDVCREIFDTPYKSGYVKCDEHTAAYAGYTSGTTGNPKGIIHELGTIVNCRNSHVYQGEDIFRPGDVLGLIAPLNFAAAIMQMNPVLCAGGEVAVAPYEYAKNPVKLNQYFKAKNVTVGFLTPSLLHALSDIPDTLRVLFLSSEPASNIYFDNIDVYNMYAQTETGCVCSAFKVDKPYSITPIGRSQIPELDLQVLDDDGQKCAPGQMGELCFENRFFREYMNLPEMTANAKRGGIYHTGDIGKYLDDGNIVLLGRNDDMVKINGNRVEPAEVEKVVKEVLNVTWAAAKVIKTEKRIFICAYYNEELTVDLEKARKKIAEKLPAYMVPTYYMYIDTIPMNANGKFSRKDLPAPDVTGPSQSSYAPPENENQRLLVEAFQEVLGLEKVGIDDDFYELGGDSVSSMEVIGRLTEISITVSDIFKGRTVREIDRILSDKIIIEYTQEANEAALKKEHHLTPFQLYIYDYQLYTPNSTMWNLPMLLRNEHIKSMENVIRVLKTVIKAHPALQTKIRFNEEMELVQYYDGSEPVIEVEKVSEAEMIDICEELIHPFKMVDSPLFRCRIFETERNVYIFLDFHHIIGDGTSLHVLTDDLMKAYYGEEIPTDFYYIFLEEKEKLRTMNHYLEDKEYYQSLYNDISWTAIPKTDFEDRSNKMATIEIPLPIRDADCKLLTEKYGISENALFIGVTLLAQAQLCQARDVMITWTFSGRDEAVKQNIFGNMLYDLPVGIRITDGMSMDSFMQEVKKQVSEGLAHTSYPYTFLENNNIGADDKTCFLYQHNIFDLAENTPEGVEMLNIPSHYASANNLLNIEVIDNGHGMSLSIEYESTRYKAETMHLLRRHFQKNVARLVQYLDKKDLAVSDLFE